MKMKKNLMQLLKPLLQLILKENYLEIQDLILKNIFPGLKIYDPIFLLFLLSNISAKKLPAIFAEDLPNISAEDLPTIFPEDLPNISTKDLLTIFAIDLPIFMLGHESTFIKPKGP